MRTLLLLLVACGAAPVRPKTCSDAWVVVHAKQNCEDLRGGISGYWIFEIVDGPHRGKTVVGRYRDAAPNERGIGLRVSNWGVARVHLGETTGAGTWDNLCVKFGPAPVHAGTVDELQGFDEQSDARRAWAAKPCEAKLATRAPRPSCARNGWELLRARYQCSDLRSGISGYWLLEVFGGPHAGKTVVARYGEGAAAQVGNWNLSRAVTFEAVNPDNGFMESSCNQFSSRPAKPVFYDGRVDASAPDNIESFEDEAEARAALASRC